MKTRIGSLVLSLAFPAVAAAVTPPTGGAIWSVRSVATEGVTDGGLDFDLDRFERPHVAYIELSAELPLARRAALLNYRRFDGMVWRTELLAEFAVPSSGAGSDGDGLLAMALSDLASPRPVANVLYLDRGGPGPADDTIRLARSGVPGPTVELVHAGSAAPGMQLSAATDGRLHAAWLDPVSGQVRHALRNAAGAWTQAVVSLAGHTPGPPSASIRSDDRYLLGYTSDGAIHLFDDSAVAPGSAALTTIAAPLAATTDPTIAVHFRSGGRLGVAWVAGADRQELRYTTGTAASFDPSPFPFQIGLDYRLPYRNALPNQEDPISVAVVLAQNATETQLTNLSGGGSPETSQQVGGFLRGVQLRGTRRYGVGYGAIGLRDVLWHQRGRAWIEASVAASSGNPLVALAEDSSGSPLLLSVNGPNLSIARWSEATNQFERENIPSSLASSGSDAALAQQRDRTVVAFRAPGGVLRGIERVGAGAWQASTLDAIGDAALEPQIGFADDGRLFALHRRRSATGDALRLVVRTSAGTFATDVVGPLAPDALSGSAARLAVVGVSGDVWISYFDRATGTLQLRHRRPSGSVTAQTIEVAGQVVGERHALTATGEGQFALAYTAQPTSGASTSIRYRFMRGITLVDELVRSGVGFRFVDDLHLALKNESGDLARMAYVHEGFVTGSRSVAFDSRQLGAAPGSAQWSAQDFGALDNGTVLSFRPWVAVQASGGDHLLVAEGAPGTRPRHFFRTNQSDDRFDVGRTINPPANRFGSEFACRCAGDELPGQTPLSNCRLVVVPSVPPARMGGSPNGRELFEALRQRFGTTPAGRYYLALWDEHGDEIARMAFSEPAQMSSRIRAIGDFTPGLAAFVAGTGGQHRMDAAMLAQAREVWLGWRDRGSPALRAAVVSEMTRLNQLNAFEGMTFDQWFNSLQVGTALDRIFANGME